MFCYVQPRPPLPQPLRQFALLGRRWPRLDVLYINAGDVHRPLQGYQRLVDINLKGPFFPDPGAAAAGQPSSVILYGSVSARAIGSTAGSATTPPTNRLVAGRTLVPVGCARGDFALTARPRDRRLGGWNGNEQAYDDYRASIDTWATRTVF